MEISRPLVDGRHTLLEVSMFRNLQFDSLRRAKFATTIILHHLHFASTTMDAKCVRCADVLSGLRWHCAECTSFDVCTQCSSSSALRCPSGHPLTPYHVTSFS
jgi:hypothetical protein